MNKFPKEQLDMLYEQAKKVDDVGLTTHILQELKEYRNLEEQGLLLKLPCKVGTVAYLIDHNFVRMERKPIKCIIDEFTVDRYNDCYAVLNGAENFYMMRRFRAINTKQFGETIFLTKEEAEKKLKELNISERN